MSGDDAAAHAPIDGRVEWRARSGGISSPSPAPHAHRRDALMLSGGRLALCTRKVLGGNRFLSFLPGGTDRRAGTPIVSLTIWNTNRVHISHGDERWSALIWREIVLARSF